MPQQPRPLDPESSAQAFFGAELRHWRTHRRLSQSELGRLVHVSGDLIAKIEKAERRPLADLAGRCDAALDTGGVLRRLTQLVDRERDRELTAAGSQGPGHTAGGGSAGIRAHRGSAPRPPVLTQRRRGQRVGSAILTSAEESARFAQWLEVGNVGPLAIEQLAAELGRLSTEYLASPPEPVFFAVREVRDRAFTLLKGHQSPSHARELHRIAGYACAVLAWICGDLGQSSAADTHARAGLFLADTANCNELQAWVWATRAKTSFWSGRHRDAAEQAGAGLDLAPATSVKVLLAAQAAEAWAELEAPRETRVALNEMVQAREAVNAADSIGGLLSCGLSRQHNYAGAVHLRLGEVPRALATSDQALSLALEQPVRSYGTEAQIHLNRVIAFVTTNELDAATEALEPVLALPPDRRLDTITQRVGRTGQHLLTPRYSRSRGAIELAERIREFTRASVSAAAE